MAIYYPELFCEKGQTLLVKKDIIYNDGTKVSAGEIGFVKDIVGYGFDILMDNGLEIRFMNSQMPDFFQKVEEGIKVGRFIDISNVIQLPKIDISNTSFRVGTVIISNKLVREQNIIMFSSDFTIKEANKTFYKGEKFYYQEEHGYYNLYDIQSFRKVLRMNDKEVKQYCQLEHNLQLV